MWSATSSRPSPFLMLVVLTAAGCGGGGGSTPPLPAAPLVATATPAATPNPGATPTAPASAGPATATTQATYTSANPTITLPTVGMIASQVTLPPGLVPDGTQLSISVSGGGSTAANGARGSRLHRAALDAFVLWSATITGPTSFPLETSAMSVTLAVGGGLPTGGTMTVYAGSGASLTPLGTMAADTTNPGLVVFDGLSPCATNANNTASSGESGESNNSNNVTTTSVTDSWNVTPAQQSVRVRRAQSGTTCVLVTTPSASALATGAFYVSDPGASATLLFPSGANGNVAPYSPLASAPLIATDFAGELINWRGGLYEQAEIRPYGSSTLTDTIVAGTLNESERGIAADPIGAHVGLVGLDTTASTCGAGGSGLKTASTCPVAIDIFDRTQGGVAAPGVSSDVSLKTYDFGMWLDPNDDVFLPGGQRIGDAGDFGAIEFVPNFGGQGYTNGPFAVFPTSSIIAQITTDASGNVYVASPGNGVSVFAPGTTVAGWMLPSSVLPNPFGPTGVGVDALGNVYLSSPQVLSSDESTVVTNAAIVVFPPIGSWSGASTTPLRTITGPATGLVSPGQLAVINTSPSSPPNSNIVLSPATVSFTASGQSQSVGVSESGYSGTFSESDTCSGIATIASGSGGFSVNAVAAGTCYATIADTNGNSTKLGVTVTTTSFTISSHARP